MFNNNKIRELKGRVDFLEAERDSHRDKIWKLESSIEMLCKHLGLEIRYVPSKTTLCPVEKKS